MIKFIALANVLCFRFNNGTEVFPLVHKESRLKFLASQNITLAKFAGFCYGVKRAVDTVKKLKAENPEADVFVLGELIHNAYVIKELESLGIITLTSLEEIPSNAKGFCVIRSHGAAPEVFEKLKLSGLEVVDLTCPDVKKVQQKAIELAKNDYYVIIVGKAEHPEVEAIYANAKLYSENVSIVHSLEQIEPIKDVLKKHKKVGVVVQTTQRISTLNEITSELTKYSKELLIYNTICQSTSMRQQEAIELSQNSDLMIVAGSKNSANTTHLAEILRDKVQTIHIQNIDELDAYKSVIAEANEIGITAGASTPQSIIDNVIKYIKEDN